MATFDDLPPGAALPGLDDSARDAAQSVQDSGRSLTLAVTDEAELVAVGLGSPQRQGRADISESEVAAAADRLVARGLAQPEPWAAGRVRPAGGLLLYAQLTLNPHARTGLTQSWDVPEGPQAVRRQRRIGVLVDVVHAGQACVATSSVPAVDAPSSVPLVLELVRLDVLVAQVVADAFDLDGAGRETVVAFADASGALVPSRVRVGADGRGELETTRRGKLGAKTVRHRTGADGFADHLRERLMAAG